MSSNGHSAKTDHAKLASSMVELYEAHWSSDLMLVVGNREFKVHRSILAIRSPVFNSMLFSKDSHQRSFILSGKQPKSFEMFLRYLYTFSIDASKLDLDSTLEIGMLAHEYQVADLKAAMAELLGQVIDPETVCPIYDCALLLDDKTLLDSAREFACDNASKVIASRKWLKLSKQAVIDMIGNEHFDAAEFAILQAVVDWCRHNPESDAKDVLTHVRYPFISLNFVELAQVARICKALFEHGFDVEHLQSLESDKILNPRKVKITAEIPTQNMIRSDRGVVLEGPDTTEGISAIFNGKGGWDGFMRFGTSIVAKLPNVIRVNTLRFNIYAGQDKGNRSVFYRLEVSVDGIRWECLANCQKFPCFFGQVFFFRSRDLQRIKITAFPIPGYQGPDKYAVEKLQCPIDAIDPKISARYHEMCPSGKDTMLYQPHSESVHLIN